MDSSNQSSRVSVRQSLRIASRTAIPRADLPRHSIRSASDFSQGQLGRHLYNQLMTLHILCSACQYFVTHSDILRATPNPEARKEYEQFSHHSIADLEKNSLSKACHLCTLIWHTLEAKEFESENRNKRRLGRSRLTIEICTLPQIEQWYTYDLYFPLRIFRGRYGRRDQPNFKVGTLVASLSVTVNRSVLQNGYDRIYSGWPLTIVDQDFPAQLAVYTNSDFTFELGKSWLKQCLADHQCCGEIMSRERKLPTRLIEIRIRHGQMTASLRCSEGLANDVTYMALSHCWGKIPTLTLTTKTYATLCSGLYLGLLPKTFRDAMIITYRLGCHYLWIDSLCIFQDSQEDWARESIKMADVYQNSLCTVSAMAAENSHSGCFVERNILASFPCRITGDKEMGLYVHKYDLDAENIEGVEPQPRRKDVLETRGWALQERLLSPRIIEYGSRMISWECRQMTASEEWPHGVETYKIKSARLKDAFIKLTQKQGITEIDSFCNTWKVIKNCYMSCSLTKPEDRLVAISGVVEVIQSCNNFSNIAGLWRENLIEELLWCAGPSPLPRPTIYIAPSWSWASITGGLGDEIYYPTEFTKEWRATITDVQVIHSNPGASKISQISGGTLTIRGILQRYKWRRSEYSVSKFFIHNLDGIKDLVRGVWLSDEPVSPSLEVWCLPVVSWTAGFSINFRIMTPHKYYVGLVVVPVEGEAGNTWRRVGLFENTYKPDVDQCLLGEERHISII